MMREIVIKLPEKVINRIVEYKEMPYTDLVIEAIYHGTPLPKGHGDIVDIETLIDMFWDGNSMEITKYDLSVMVPIVTGIIQIIILIIGYTLFKESFNLVSLIGALLIVVGIVVMAISIK